MWERIIENATISVSKLKFDELGSFKSKFSRNEASSLDLFKYLTSESSKAHFHTREEGVNSNSGEKQAARPHFLVSWLRMCVFQENVASSLIYLMRKIRAQPQKKRGFRPHFLILWLWNHGFQGKEATSQIWLVYKLWVEI